MVSLAGFDFGLSFLWNWLFWALFIIFVFGVAIGSLIIRKKRKFVYPTYILNDLGNGKMGYEKSKAGWFRTKKFFFGLVDVSGERQLEIKDGRLILQGSTEDFHEINHKRGLAVYAKSDDPKMLFPIKRMKVENKELVVAVAPADYRDASAKIVREAERETQNQWERMAPFVVFGVLAIVMLVGIILVIQFAKTSIADANNILSQALEKKAEVIESINIVSASSTAKFFLSLIT